MREACKAEHLHVRTDLDSCCVRHGPKRCKSQQLSKKIGCGIAPLGSENEYFTDNFHLYLGNTAIICLKYGIFGLEALKVFAGFRQQGLTQLDVS